MSRTFRMNFNSDTDHLIFSPEQSPVLLKKRASFLISYQYLKLSILKNDTFTCHRLSSVHPGARRMTS